jgi:hypothetical protein
MASRGYSDLSPPEARHALLELPTNRAEYIGMLQDIGDYPARSPLGQRVPPDKEVQALAGLAGRWRAILLLDDERALKNAAALFSRVFVLDPFYDSAATLYAAWHDRLDGVVCAGINDVIVGLDVALGPHAVSRWMDVSEPNRIEDPQSARAIAWPRPQWRGPECAPALARKKINRRPLCLVSASN